MIKKIDGSLKAEHVLLNHWELKVSQQHDSKKKIMSSVQKQQKSNQNETIHQKWKEVMTPQPAGNCNIAV